MVRLLSGAWRSDLSTLAASARKSALVVAPFIKEREAAWLCKQFRSGVEITTLANINSEAVSTSALDLAALLCFARASAGAEVIALSNLHAKVFVADDKAAIVTSGNLTRAGLDGNLEYGVFLEDSALVGSVRSDMLALATIGSRVEASTLAELMPLEAALRQAKAKLADATDAAQREFAEALRSAKSEFAATQVGSRTAHAVFADAIRFVLRKGPQPTEVIEREISRLMPTLCDDSEYLYIRGERYGRAWKRTLRHAQQHLKRQGIIERDAGSQTWALRNAG